MIQVEVEARRSRNQALGSFSVNFTVYLSGASTLSTISRRARFGLPFVARKRSYVYFTSSAVKSRPLHGGLGRPPAPFRRMKTLTLTPPRIHGCARAASKGRLARAISVPRVVI